MALDFYFTYGTGTNTVPVQIRENIENPRKCEHRDQLVLVFTNVDLRLTCRHTMTIEQQSRVTNVRRAFRFFILLPTRTFVVGAAFLFLFVLANFMLAVAFLLHLSNGPDTTLRFRSSDKRVQFTREWVQTRHAMLHNGEYPMWYVALKNRYFWIVKVTNTLVLVSLGYYTIKVKGVHMPRADADILISNHRGLIDALVFIRGLDVVPVFVSGPTLLDIPLVSTIALSIDVFIIDPSSKTHVIDRLQHILQHTDRQIVLFPEIGGATHGSHIRVCAAGSFRVSTKMQPCALAYQHVGDVNPSWSSDMDLADLVLLLIALSLREINHASIEFRRSILRQPGESIPSLAQNYREDISRSLGVPMHDDRTH